MGRVRRDAGRGRDSRTHLVLLLTHGRFFRVDRFLQLVDLLRDSRQLFLLVLQTPVTRSKPPELKNHLEIIFTLVVVVVEVGVPLLDLFPVVCQLLIAFLNLILERDWS